MSYLLERRSIEVEETALAAAPEAPAVFVIRAGDSSPYLGRTAVLRRRLNRVMKLWNLKEIATSIDYFPTASRLESSLAYYELARTLFPEDYVRRVKLRFPAYFKLILANEFPRTQVTTRLSGGRSLYYGPFRTRQSAEQFEPRFLDLFQIRRCQEDLKPHEDHPGCVYGEMNFCLRPCQMVVGVDEYGSEVKRVADFLRGGGAAALQSARATRDRLSAELHFEEAGRMHKRYERIQEVMALSDELARDVDSLNGVAVTRAEASGSICLWFLLRGWWQQPLLFPVGASSGSLDHRLREIAESLPVWEGTARERQEHIAILAGWKYSSYCDGEWLGFEDLARLPYRKLVNAVARVGKL